MKESDRILLDKYFDGSLSPEEEVLFAQRIAEDPLFEAEVELLNNARQAIIIGGRDALQARFKAIDKQLDQKPPSFPGRKWIWMIVLPTLFVFSLCLYFFLPPLSRQQLSKPVQQQKDSLGDTISTSKPLLPATFQDTIPTQKEKKALPKQVYALDVNALMKTHFSAYSDDVIEGLKDQTRSDSANVLQTWLKAYVARDYKSVIANYTKLPDKAARADKTRVILGNAYLVTHEPDKVMALFDPEAITTDNKLATEIYWLLGWAWLQKGKQTQSLAYFKKVSEDTGNLRQASALKLVDTLSKANRDASGQ